MLCEADEFRSYAMRSGMRHPAAYAFGPLARAAALCVCVWLSSEHIFTFDMARKRHLATWHLKTETETETEPEPELELEPVPLAEGLVTRTQLSSACGHGICTHTLLICLSLSLCNSLSLSLSIYLSFEHLHFHFRFHFHSRCFLLFFHSFASFACINYSCFACKHCLKQKPKRATRWASMHSCTWWQHFDASLTDWLTG